jgi:hypothetical protein
LVKCQDLLLLYPKNQLIEQARLKKGQVKQELWPAILKAKN